MAPEFRRKGDWPLFGKYVFEPFLFSGTLRCSDKSIKSNTRI
ncbi:hypothetical protein HMPREF1981_02646 [Bacteroides pyogenes F0041]|uniref:Uncharacterized protein n=1 Tax=Bacteroides pyogenes F0041 TaxID=1321819 RepID=U2CDQ0_9BACE|nr:hypothetical protein HMPREF1981_02646 [Bacteroides pyogenes F0041]